MRQRSTTPADLQIGQRIRSVRLAAHISQAALGEAVGVSFQQIQKYEKGTNRVGGARLIEIATALKIDPHYLLDAVDSPDDICAGGPPATTAFLATKDGAEIAEAFARLSDPALRRAAARFITDLADAFAPLEPAQTVEGTRP